MKTKKAIQALALLLSIPFALFTLGCEQKSDTEKAMDNAAKEMEKAGDNAADAASDAMKKTEEAAKDAQKKAENAVNN